MAHDLRLWLILSCIITLASLGGGCLGGYESYYGRIGCDSHVIFSYNDTAHPINDSIYSTLLNEINITGLQGKPLSGHYIATIKFDDPKDKSNHLGGGIYLNFTKWIDEQIFNHRQVNASDFPYLNDTDSAIIIDDCYLTDRHYSASSNLTEITEPFRLKLKHYNDILTEILQKVLDAKIESEEYTPRGAIIEPNF